MEDPAGGSWRRLLCELSSEWRVFWAHPPLEGERVPVGSPGADPVTLDTLPAITRVLSQQVVSAVVLVGNDAVEGCLEPLHAFAPHLGYVALLTGPLGSGGHRVDGSGLLDSADWVLLSDPALEGEARSLLLTSGTDCDVLPNAGKKWARFLAAASRRLEDLYLRSSRPAAAKDLAVYAVHRGPNGPTAREVWEREAALSGCRDRTAWAPDVPWSRRLARRLPAWRWRLYRGWGEAIGSLNQALLSARREHSLVLGDGLRLHPGAAEGLFLCALRQPRVGAVGYLPLGRPDPLPWGRWVSFADDWALRRRGAIRAVSRLADDGFVLPRSVIERVGGFDPRLEWPLAARDLWLRARQAGLRLLVAEDVVAAPARSAPRAEPDTFVRKWKLDPLALASR